MLSEAEEEFEIVTVQSGARSLRSRACGETFHPVIGPMEEARRLHVEGQRLIERARSEQPLVVWDVGLGAAANAIAVLQALRGFQVELYSFDQTSAPLAFALKHAEALEYIAPYQTEIKALLVDGQVQISGLEWRFCAGDFKETMQDPSRPAPHAILYDPYSPSTNPDLWTLEHFARLHARLDPTRPCLLTNYTRSTAVRVTLLLAGFFVGRGGATGEKEETTTAANRADLITQPLDSLWLQRVARSTRGAPLRAGGLGSPVGADDLAGLHAHPQFG